MKKIRILNRSTHLLIIFMILMMIPAPIAGSEQTYTITFYSDGNEYEKQIIDSGKKLNIPLSPALPAGMVSFIGWAKQENDPMNLYNFSTPVTDGFNLYAHFSNKYLISFKDADGYIYQTQLVEKGGRVSTITTPPSGTNDVFLYWAVGDTTDRYDFSTPVNNNIILKPIYGNSHYVYFSSMKGTPVDEQLIPNGQIATEPANPARVGYKFAFWSANQAATADDPSQKYDFQTLITDSITLYAVWKPDEDNKPEVKVILWKEKENLPLNFDKTDLSNYVYHDSYITWELAGTEATVTEDDVQNFVPDVPEYSDFYRAVPTIVEGDGSSAINVYYTYTVYTIHFNLNGANSKMTVGDKEYTENDPKYSIQAKYNMNLEKIWPLNGQETFLIERAGYNLRGWMPPSNLNDLSSNVVWASKRVTLTPSWYGRLKESL